MIRTLYACDGCGKEFAERPVCSALEITVRAVTVHICSRGACAHAAIDKLMDALNFDRDPRAPGMPEASR